MNLIVTADQVRDFANITATTGRYSDAALGSNIRSAQAFIERETNRQFTQRTGSFKFTTEGRAQFAVPDFRSLTSVVWDGATLTENESYWSIPDARNSGVYVALQLRSVDRGGKWYYSNPEWWDRGLDWPRRYTSDANDLVVTSDEWGWSDYPDDLMLGIKALAAWYTKRADALLANAVQGPDGSILDYSQLPNETQAVIRAYARGEQVAAI